MRSGKPGGGKDPLVKEEMSLALSTQNTQTVFEKVNIYDLTHHDEVVREIHGNKTQTLKARARTGGNNTPIVQCLNDQGGSVMDVSDKAGTLRAESHGHPPCVHTCYSFDSKASNSMKSSNPHSGCHVTEKSKCLDTTTPDPSKNQGGVAVCTTFALEGNGSRPSHKGDGYKETDKMYTLNTTEVHAVAVGYRAGQYGQYVQDDKAGSARASGGDLGGAAKP
jgi:hypothetical protein